jgi:hypothetical protein
MKPQASSLSAVPNVVKEYPEQKGAVATARLRLEDPNAAKAALQRQVWTGPKVDVYGSRSGSSGRIRTAQIGSFGAGIVDHTIDLHKGYSCGAGRPAPMQNQLVTSGSD